MKTIHECLADVYGNYQLVAMRQVGEDRLTHGVNGYVVGHTSTKEKGYALWSYVDWSNHPNRTDRDRGFEIMYGLYDLTKYEAMLLLDKKVTEAKENYEWLIPGTNINIKDEE